MNQCDIGECTRKKYSSLYCQLHYRRWKKHGDPRTVGWARNAEEAFAMHVRADGDCLVWTGTRTNGGYGRISVHGHQVSAHRWAFEREHGPIPAGMQIDHICWNRACVNVEHLRLATLAENRRNLSGHHAGRTSGNSLPRGVHKNRNGYIASVKSYGESWNRYFATAQEADTWVRAKRSEVFKEFAGRG